MNVMSGDRRRLAAIVSDRNAPQKHVWRAKIILATAEGCGTAEIMRRSGKSKPVVWRWQARFMAEGVEGLTRDPDHGHGCSPRKHPNIVPQSTNSSPNETANARPLGKDERRLQNLCRCRTTRDAQ